MTGRRFDPLRPVIIVITVGSALGLVALILLLGARKPARRLRQGRFKLLRGAVVRALQRIDRAEGLRNAA